ncbi:hypothetical protein [Chroococcidiopsis thermalis]|uniref:Lipoprotein n=1 Tax=Chroococcidiopsis thermalis (strain PCC 7203) TaxID=251229 RepID=K9TSM2_CHRTP|nr:hypothetical protein [Chroococcidiopsis thermalis]AFY85802.1 hypothetical protein Chro_0247 [Chroococcidiopsis thermalis PCC 7203]
MKKICPNLGLTLATSLFLASCGGVQEQASQLKDKANQAQNVAQQAQDVASKTTSAIGNLGNLKATIRPLTDGTTQTLSAVKAGNFSAAQTEFTKLQDSWKGLEGTLKTVSPNATKTIGEKITTIATDLKSGSPNVAKLTTELQGLSTAFSSLTSGTPGVAANTSSPTETGTANSNAGSATAIQSNLVAMKDELAKASTAVESKDFATAKTAFGAARQTWYKFGGSVKQKSPDTYQRLEAGVQDVNSGLSKAQPPRDTVLTSLKTLSTDLDGVK